MEKIFVLGAGTMGAGIVQAFAQKGYEVIVRDIKDEFVERGLAGINKNLSKLVSKGKMSEETKEAIVYNGGLFQYPYMHFSKTLNFSCILLLCLYLFLSNCVQ